MRQLGVAVKLARTPGEPARLPGPALGEHTEAALLAAGYTRARSRAARGRARPRPAPAAGQRRARPPAHGRERGSARACRPAQRGLLKMSELAERSGVSPGTIRYYLREGLLGDGGASCARAATWPTTRRSYVELIGLIKRLQEERFMPLRLIRSAGARNRSACGR